MSLLKSTINKVFNKTRTISPGHCCVEFCWRDIHDPLYECCFAAEIDGTTNSTTTQSFKRKNCKIKRRKCNKRPKQNRPASRLYKVSPTTNLLHFPANSNSTLSLNASGGTASQPDKSYVVHKSITNLPQNNGLRHGSVLESLCDRFETLGITELIPSQCRRFNKLYAKIPEHDKRIINRMAMKRSEEIARIEDASIARKYWDNERFCREIMVSEHNEQFTNAIKAKREQESNETKERLKMLAERDRSYFAKIKEEILRKNERLRHRLRNVTLAKEIRKCERQQVELEKYEAAIVAQQDRQLTDALRKQECFSHLESRISRADAVRNHYLQAFKRRLCADNETEQNMHAVNYEETKRIERYKLELLKQQIRERDRKSIEFRNRKERVMCESRNQARATSELRDIIRRSISPDNYSFRAMLVRGSSVGGGISERPMSNLSYQSHVKLG